MRYRLAGIVAIVGVLVGYAGGAMMQFAPFPIQRLLRNPVADAAVMVLAVGTALCLVLWARQPAHTERGAFVSALGAIGVIAIVLNVVAPAVGLWGGPIFDAPLLPLALLTGLRAMLLLGLLLLLYRWLAARRRWLAVLVYLAILVALVPATYYGDSHFLRSGALTFGGGYTVWHDMVVGEIFFLLPPVLYERLLRRAPRSNRVA